MHFKNNGDNYFKESIVGDSCIIKSQISLLSYILISSVQFSHSVMSDSLQPHGLQHARPPCPSPTPGVYPNSFPLNRWCLPTISSSAIPFSCLQSFPASGSFQMSQLFASGGQSIGVSASTSVLPINSQDWSPLGWTGWISLQSKGLSTVFSNTTVQKHQFFGAQLSYSPTLTSIYMTTGKTIALTRQTFSGKAMSLLFNMLSRLVITFIPKSKRLLISWLQSPSAVILGPPKIKPATVCTVSPSICHEAIGLDAMILIFLMLSFKPAFSLSSFTFIKRLFFTFCHKGGIICISEVIDISPGNLDSSLWLHPTQRFSWHTLNISK